MKRRNRIRLGFRRAAARAFVLAPLIFLLVAGAGCPSLFESNTQRAAKVKQAEVGKDGTPPAITAPTTVNGYAALGADAAAGARSITYAVTADALFTVLEEGDLVLIIQMQGATINPTDAADAQFPATSAYGAVTALGGAGKYELAGVEGVNTGTRTISLACRLKNSYTTAGKTQIIRVPQYATLTVNSGGSITAPAWNGTTGGVVAVHAESTVTLNGTGKIDVSGLGFRGGARDTSSAPQGDPKNVIFRSDDPLDGGEKGESVAGYQDGYPNARYYGRGAPANGGGGGNSHNSGGGGGANAASGAAWTGQGVMAGCTATSPWRLDDGYTSNPATAKCATSQGGGRGGYSLSFASNQDPTSLAPGDTNWRGNRREQVGGLGGRPVPNSVGGTDPRLFVGGGGGAGDGDNNLAGPGGNGGGLVFVIAGVGVAGDGSIVANGALGGDATVTGNNYNDAAGGGGGGGTIVISAPTISAISITANGGRGGNHAGGSTNAGQNTEEAEGPGGGGGGGYVAVTGTSTATIEADGGDAGTTDRTVMTDFPQNGATAGNAGVTGGSAAGLLYCAFQLTTIDTHPDAITNSTIGVFTFSNPVAGVTYECRLYTTTPTTWGSCNGVDAGSDNGYTAAGLTEGTHTFEVRATDTGGGVVEDPPASYTWTVDLTPPNTSIVSGPLASSVFTTATFGFQGTDTPVTFECSLDGAAYAACPATHTIASLGIGHHTLSVRAKDAAGNVDLSPAPYAWDIIAVGMDGGVLDGGGIDTGEIDTSPVVVDGGKDDVPQIDVPVISPVDGGVTVDAGSVDVGVALDAQTVDVSRLDSAPDGARDVASDNVASADLEPDVQSTGAEPGPDTATVIPVEPNRDAALVVREDAAPKADAAIVVEVPSKLLGGGFCTIAPARSASPALFMVLALAGLALLRRRRR
jgi:MYXO-CTERM domain-containing protein